MAIICDDCGIRLDGETRYQDPVHSADLCRACWEAPLPCGVCSVAIRRGEERTHRISLDGEAVALHWDCQERVVFNYVRAQRLAAQREPEAERQLQTSGRDG